MRLAILTLLIAAAASKRIAPRKHYLRKFEAFKRKFERKYEPDTTEHAKRFEIFMDNVDEIISHNAKGLSWKYGINQFADMTVEEFANHTSCMGGLKKFHGQNVKELDDENLADSVDWDAEGMVTPVKNQGQCGSCWAFSTTGSVESRAAIAAGASSPNSLSEQELVDCSSRYGNNGCNGGLMDYGFQYVRDQGGLCSEDDYPYKAKTNTIQCTGNRAECSQKLDNISSYADVRSRSMTQLAAAVSQGPVSIAIQANQRAFQLYKSGVLKGSCGSRLDHGVLVVGYGTDSAEGDFWKVKNSWGSTWGENGYIRLCKDCGANGTAGQCGILLQPSYPVV